MVPIEIRKENRNRYFSRTSIIICRKFIVAIAYSIRIKLAHGKWRTSSYELNNAHEQLKMLQKHLSHVWRTPWKSIQEIIILSGPLDIFKPQAITSHVLSADYFRLMAGAHMAPDYDQFPLKHWPACVTAVYTAGKVTTKTGTILPTTLGARGFFFPFFPFFLSACDSCWFEAAHREKKFRNVAERWSARFILPYM